MIGAGATLGVLAYLLSGVTVIEPGEVGVLQRWGRQQGPLLGPGLHVRWPRPVERVTEIAADRVRVARIGLVGSRGAIRPSAGRLEHRARRIVLR